MPANYLQTNGLISVTLDGSDFWVAVDLYANSSRPALLFVSQADPHDNFLVTANPQGEAVGPNELLVKNYAENRGVLEALETAGMAHVGQVVFGGSLQPCADGRYWGDPHLAIVPSRRQPWTSRSPI